MPTVRKIPTLPPTEIDAGAIEKLRSEARSLRATYERLLDETSREALEQRLKLLARLKNVEHKLHDLVPHDPSYRLTETFISEELKAEFWSQVDRSGACWRWLGPVQRGRGRFLHIDVTFIDSWAYRTAFLIAHGPIPTGQDVRHRCANALCVNPGHLRLGHHWENMLDISVRRARGIVSPQVFTYEDDLATAQEIVSRRLRGAKGARRSELEGQLAYIQLRLTEQAAGREPLAAADM